MALGATFLSYAIEPCVCDTFGAPWNDGLRTVDGLNSVPAK